MRVKFFPEQCYLRVGMQMNHHFCASLLGKVANNYAKEGCCGLLRVTLNGPKRPSGSGQGCYPPVWPSRGPGWGFKSWARVRAAARSTRWRASKMGGQWGRWHSRKKPFQAMKSTTNGVPPMLIEREICTLMQYVYMSLLFRDERFCLIWLTCSFT